MNILITGATGFVGSALLHSISLQYNNTTFLNRVQFNRLLSAPDDSTLLANIDVIIHLAARVHIMYDAATEPLQAFRQINTTATLNLARQAAATGVRRFVFLSTIKVNGEYTTGLPFVPEEYSIPTDPYALSKYEAEHGLKEIAKQTSMEVIIIRAPLVYGQGVKGNFHQLLCWVNKGIPLPLGAIYNQRSMIALDNLVDLLILCIKHPKATNQTFLVSDDEDLSTTQLLQYISQALAKPNRLIPVPQKILTSGLTLLGKRDIAQRLCSDLQVNISKTKQLLDWKPPLSVNEAINTTTQAWLETHRG